MFIVVMLLGGGRGVVGYHLDGSERVGGTHRMDLECVDTGVQLSQRSWCVPVIAWSPTCPSRMLEPGPLSWDTDTPTHVLTARGKAILAALCV